jgi:hypothetical protein
MGRGSENESGGEGGSGSSVGEEVGTGVARVVSVASAARVAWCEIMVSKGPN